MQFSLLSLAASVALVSAQSSGRSLTTNEVFSRTVTVNQNGHVYLKTRVETYTGQATTDPTSGTITTVFTIENSLATYTKTVVQTFDTTTAQVSSVSDDGNKADDITTTVTYSQQYQTYTKTLTGESAALSNAAGTASSTNGATGFSIGLGGIAMAAALLI